MIDDSNSKDPIEQILEFMPREWQCKHILFRVYSILGLRCFKKEVFKRLVDNIEKEILNGKRIKIATFNGPFQFEQTFYHMNLKQDDGTEPVLEKIKRSLPKDKHIIVLITPLYNYNDMKSDKCDKEILSQEILLNQEIGFMKMIFGNNIAHEKYCSAIINVNTREQYAFTQLTYRRPDEIGGIHANNKDELSEINNKLASINRDTKNRILRALSLIETASNSEPDEKFSFYFMAIECIYGKIYKQPECTEELSRHYNRPKEYIEKELHIKQLFELRAGYFHRGKFININQSEERYLQLLCIDLIRNFTGLPCKFYAEKHLINNKVNFIKA
ncbi:MAG: hypothetical protein V3V61_05095 [Gammaproteobacteria bacterium]